MEENNNNNLNNVVNNNVKNENKQNKSNKTFKKPVKFNNLNKKNNQKKVQNNNSSQNNTNISNVEAKENQNKLENTNETKTNTKVKKNVKNNNTNKSNNKNVVNPKNVMNTNFNKDGKKTIKIIPLGGLEEIGKNITVFEYDEDIIVVDCGLAFPDDDMLGVDIVIPDVTYLEKNVHRIKGMVITHGHEDHIGAIPYVLKKINVPVYATPLTVGLINAKLKEHKIDQIRELNVVKFGDVLKLGKFSVEFIASAHSIPDCAMLAIKTEVGTIVHTGDFKIEYTPVDGVKMNLARLGELGNEGVLALLSDSTNSEQPGFTMSEKSVGTVFDELFENCKKRIIVSTFASNVNRVQELVRIAQKYNRKVAVSGRSMEKMLEIARELNYVDLPNHMFIELDEINTIPDERLLILSTGSQGEPMAALTRIANGEHKKIKLNSNDLVIISATPIPGNEPGVSKVINTLLKRGVEVIYSSLKHIHVSGHACQEEQKLILALTKPKFFIPVHGETRQLMAHRRTAISMGHERESIIIMENGKVLELNEDGYNVNSKVESGKVFVDGLGVGDVGNIVLRDRQHLSQDGLIIAVINLNEDTKELIGEPDIISRGFVYVKENEELLDQLKQIVKEVINTSETKEWSTLKSLIKSKLTRFIIKKTKRDPMILPIIVEG